MSDNTGLAKRLLLGRPYRSDRLGHTLLSKRIALPVFASDALSSVAYAPDEIILTLSIAGIAAAVWSPWVGLAVVVVLVVVVAGYRQTVHAYPSGGGDYEVATSNFGPRAGLTVGSALLVDYTLTVAVSISSAAQYASSAIPALRGYEVPFAISLVTVLMLMNLRGIKESGTIFAIPTYLFMIALGAMAVVGFARYFADTLPLAESATLEVIPEEMYEQGLIGLAGALLILRAFATGCAALTGVEALSNGVPNFRKPKSRNAATTLGMLGALSFTFLLSSLLLARATGIRYVENPEENLLKDGGPVGPDYVQHPVLIQLSEAVFEGFPVAFYLISIATGLILVLAANTAFNGFPVLGSILAKDGFLPRQLHSRGDRLAFSNGIVALSVGAALLIWLFDAQVSRLIQLYIVGVFISFTLGQLGMVRHWNRTLSTEHDAARRGQMLRSRAINAAAFGLTSAVLVVILISKFTRGAWITLVAVAVVYGLMTGIRRHYDQVRDEVALGDDADTARALPSRVHAIVLASRLHKPTMRAISYARATRPSTLEAVTVNVDAESTDALRQQWEDLEIPVPLRVLDSPYREITRPILGYVKSIRRESPRDLVVVYIPEYVVGHPWENLLHNQSALRLKSRLLFTPGVVVASVPWQLESSAAQAVDGGSR